MTANITSKLFTIQYTDTLNGEIKSFYFGNLPTTSAVTLPSGAVHVLDWGFVNDNIKRLIRNSSALLSVPPKAPEYVTNFYNMFRDCRLFTGDGLGTWDMSGATSTRAMFFGCSSFVKGISNWDVSNVTDMSNMFDGCKLFNDDLSKWDVSNVKNFSMMFYGCISFNQWIGSWDISSGTDFTFMFYNTTVYNQDLTTWDVLELRSRPSDFDTGATSWETNNKPMWGKQPVVIDDTMESGYVKFTGKDKLKIFKYKIVSGVNKLPEVAIHVSNWGTTNIKGVALLMSSSVETVPVTSPDYVSSFENMFNNCSSFNDPNISQWEVGHVTSMSCMFGNCTIFNQPLDKWDVSNNKDFRFMFQKAISYNQDLSSWDVSHISEEPTDFAMDVEGWVLPKPRWGKIMVDDSIEKGFIKYRTELGGEIFKQEISTTESTALPEEAVEIVNWGTLDEVVNFYIKTSRVIVKVPDHGPSWTTNYRNMFAYNYCFNDPNVSKWDVSHVVDISHMFIYAPLFNQPLNDWDVSNVKNMDHILHAADEFNQPLDKWDMSNVTSLSDAFRDAISFNQPLNDWDVSNVKNMGLMFYGAISFNQPLDKWDVSNVENMSFMFREASCFNEDITTWDVSKVTRMSFMFESAEKFNQDISSWDVSNVPKLTDVFRNAISFNQDISSWDVSNAKGMGSMFEGAISFNQDISSWDVSKVKDMTNMFKGAISFNQDLSCWNVALIDEKPTKFDEGASKWELPRPIWGTNGGDVESAEGKIQYIVSDTNSIGSIDIMEGLTIVPNTYRVVDWGYINSPKEGVVYSIKLPKNIVTVPTTEPNYITNMDGMFEGCDIMVGKNLENWNTEKITSMRTTFKNTKVLDVDLSNWDVSNVTNMEEMFMNSGIKY